MQTPLAKLADYYPTVFNPAVSVEPVSGGFSGARVWRLFDESRAFALRCWPNHGLSNARIVGLHRLLIHLHEAKLPFVAAPIVAKTGSTLVQFDGQRWQIEPWLPGQPDTREMPEKQRLKNAVLAIADWHDAAATFQAVGSERDWFSTIANRTSPAIRERLTLTDSWLNQDLARLRDCIRGDSEFDQMAGRIFRLEVEALPLIRRELVRLVDRKFTLQPCLRDVWREHVLFDGQQVTGIIDPSACRTENIVTDLARFVGSYVGDNPELWWFAIESYSEKRSLTDDEYQLVRTLDRSAVVLSPLTWLQKRYLSGQPFDEQAVLNRLREQEQRLTFLLSRDAF